MISIYFVCSIVRVSGDGEEAKQDTPPPLFTCDVTNNLDFLTYQTIIRQIRVL